jgi:N-acetylmuramoyl-L-alanine amidase
MTENAHSSASSNADPGSAADGAYHVVEQGEWLAKIARHYGFSDWRKIYYHPENQEFRSLRPNPNVLYPGDRVFVPFRETKSVARSTNSRHKFALTGRRERLELCIVRSTRPVDKDTEKRTRSTPYRLRFGADVIDGETDAQGVLRVDKLPADVSRVVLEIEDQCFDVLIGHLDPVSEITGVQVRLNQLGYGSGEVDGILGPRTRAALAAFQSRNGLEATGQPAPETTAKLKELFES